MPTPPSSRCSPVAGMLVTAVATLVALAGCGDSAESGLGGRPSSGALGQVSVAPECGALNQGCLVQGLNAPLALGSRTELVIEYQIAGSSGPPTTLETADATVLATASATAVDAVGTGASAVLFVGPDETVLDFIHLWVAQPEELRILRYSPAGDLLGQVQDEISLLVGDEILVSVEPYAAAQPLLGNFELERTIDGESVSLVPDSVGGWYRVVARAPGDSTVTFSALGIEKTWQIEVLP